MLLLVGAAHAHDDQANISDTPRDYINELAPNSKNNTVWGV